MKGNNTSRAGVRKSATVQREPNPPHRILVVDDERDIRRVIVHAPMGSGYYVDAAEDGAAAWEALQIKAFNLLITDHNIPRLTGVELVRKLRSARMALPVILVTGQLPAEVVVQNPLFQLAALLPKPFYLRQLSETVRAVLQATGSIPRQLELLPVWPGQSSAAGLRV